MSRKNVSNSLFLGRPGEEACQQLIQTLAIGKGFEIFFVLSDNFLTLSELERRLAGAANNKWRFEKLEYKKSKQFLGLLDDLFAKGREQEPRRVFWISSRLPPHEQEACWRQALILFNERRNTLIREVPHVLILAGSKKLGRMASNVAPDFWSVRSRVFRFADPPRNDSNLATQIDAIQGGESSSEVSEAPEYYLDLAEALAGSRYVEDKRSQAALIAKAAKAFENKYQWSEAKIQVEMALNIYREIEDASGESEMYFNLGRLAFFHYQGTRQEALEWHKTSLAIKEELGNRSGMAISYHQLGRVAEERGSYDEALEWYKKSLAIAEELGNRSGMAISYHQLGIVAQKRGSDDEALEWYKKSLAIVEELGNRSGMASSYHQLGMVAQKRGIYDEALEWYKKSLAIKEEIGDRGGMAITYHQLGLVAQDRGSYDEALEWYKKSLAIAEELGDRSGMATTYHNLGMVAQERGSDDEALEWYKKSLAIAEELGNRSGMASSYHQLGIVAQKRGSDDEALEWYKKSLAIVEELGDRSGMAGSYHQLGMVAQDRGNYDEALEWYKKSLAITEKLGNRSGMAISYHQLGRVAEERGSYDEALEWYKKSLAIAEELGNRGGMATSLSQIGALFTEQENVEEAIPYNLKSLAIRLEIKVPDTRKDLFWLSRQKKALGESRFREVIEKEIGQEQAANVFELMEQHAKAQAKADESGDEE
jgi:tetratricopeptide (TPR) repeat protein